MKADVILRLETRSEPVVEEIAYVHAVILGRSGLEELINLNRQTGCDTLFKLWRYKND